MTDMHRILARLQPEPDGEPTLSRRTATLTAINGDGTVQINLSGVDVRARALSGWNMQVGTTVQVLVERGDLLVLGEAVTPGGGFVTNITQGVIDFGSADTLVCVPHGIPFTPDPAHFQLTARNNPGATMHWWVDSADATDLCVMLDESPGDDFAVAWRHIGGPLAYGCADNADIVHDGWAYHVFTSAGTFTPTMPGIFDVLVVAGGGAGGNAGSFAGDSPIGVNKPQAGGGGAGGVITALGWAVTIPTPVVVGNGGAVGAAHTDPSSNGDNSTFDVLVAIGGGAGGNGTTPPNPGGSGGGSARDFGAGGGSSGAPGTPGQGHDGGDGGITSGTSAGGGGGAGTPGTSGEDFPTNPAGGDGVYIAEFDVPGLGSPQGWFGGGGGGGRYGAGNNPSDGGLGGGGGSGGTPTSGVAGTGGGGSGARSQQFGIGYFGGDGGDGIVIIRHPVCVPIPQ